MYVFNGSYRDGNLILASTPSYFELTSFPAPITTMKVTGVLGTGGVAKPQFTGLSLLAEYTETSGSLIEFLCQLLDHWIDLDIPGIGTICDLLQNADMRTAAIARFAAQAGIWAGRPRRSAPARRRPKR